MDVFIDFETRSRANLKKVGAYVYGAHPSTTLLCLAFAIDHRPAEIWQPGENLPTALTDAVAGSLAGDDITWNAHNASFERIIWREVLCRLFAIPDLPVTSWRCTAARCAAAGLPRSLEGAAKAMGLTQGKDMEGRRLMLDYTKPKPDGTFKSDPQDLRRIAQYCATDVMVERKLHDLTPALTEAEQRIWQMDQVINDRGIPIDYDFATRCVEQLTRYRARLNEELSRITGGYVQAASQVQRLIEWMVSRGVNLGKSLSADVVRGLLNGSSGLDLTGLDDVRRALEIRAELSKTSTAKYDSILSQCCPDKRVRGAHLYWGGHTGRWAGRGVQTQNLPRGKVKAEYIEPLMRLVRSDRALELTELIYGDPVDVLSSLIRPTICAKSGKVLIPCDFASIEARGLAWLAGEKELLEAFRAGECVYRKLAAKIYEVAPEEVTGPQRQLGKTATLGLGYGMGPAKFTESCHKQNIEITEEFSRDVVDVYRNTNGAIVKLWENLNLAAIECVATRTDRIVGRVTFKWLSLRGKEWLRCWLPSGRPISYASPHLERVKTPWGSWGNRLCYWAEDSVSRQWRITQTYGGKLAENITQAVCRDVLASAMARVEAAGVPIVMHVHDEVVPEVDERAGVTAGDVEKLVSVRPRWAAGFPIAAEGFVSRRYRK